MLFEEDKKKEKQFILVFEQKYNKKERILFVDYIL